MPPPQPPSQSGPPQYPTQHGFAPPPPPPQSGRPSQPQSGPQGYPQQNQGYGQQGYGQQGVPGYPQQMPAGYAPQIQNYAPPPPPPPQSQGGQAPQYPQYPPGYGPNHAFGQSLHNVPVAAAAAPSPGYQSQSRSPPPAAGAPGPAAGGGGNQAGQDMLLGATLGGRYKVEKLLGRGGMGAVYAVKHLNTGESLALKVLNPALASNSQAVERFRTEARAPVRIGTDHVVRIVDADVSAELGDVPYLVMELLDGRDLGTELKRRGALPAGEVVLYLRQVARALDKAHSIGIIHRDLKPANLYLTTRDDGSPLIKILDFGIAKLTDGMSAEMTQDGTIFGTPWYMSPEQARGLASKVGTSADLWALGLIAFRLLTGRNYWTAEGMAALIGQIVYDPMPPPSQMAPHLGPKFDAWFMKACNREIEQRFTTATELVRELAGSLGVSHMVQPTGQWDQQSLSMSGAPGMSMSGMPGGLSISGMPGGVSPQMPMPGGQMPGGQMPGPQQMAGAPQQPMQAAAGGQAPPPPASGTPMSMANASSSGSMSVSGMPMTATPPPGSVSVQTAVPVVSGPASVRPKRSSAASAAIGVMAFVILAGGGLTAWLLLGKRGGDAGPATGGTASAAVSATTAPSAAPPASASAAPTASAAAVATAAPTASASADVPAAPTASASASAAAAAPTGAPTADAAAKAPAHTATAAAGAPPVPGKVDGAAKPAPTGAPKAAPNKPKVGKIKF